MDNNIHVKLENESKELTILTGSALTPKEPRKVVLSGTITAPGDYAEARKETFEPVDANVVANYTDRTIVLVVNESDHYCSTITGKLELFPDLKELGINDNKLYSEKALLSKINFFGRYFVDQEAYNNLKSKLIDFKAKVDKTFVNADDYKGSSAIEKITKIEHEIPLLFELNIPVFTGGATKSFKVDICVSARDGGVSFWLESVELYELIQRDTEAIFNLELSRLTDYLIVKQW